MHQITSFLVSILLICLFLPQKISAQQAEISSQTEQLLDYQEIINTEYLRKHLSVIAADSLKGRDTGSAGQKTAARYLARQYESLGLQPAGDNNSFFQNFDLSALKRDSTVFELYRSGELIEHSVESADTTGRFIRTFGGSDTISGDIVFAGFGVNDPARNVDHLGDMDLEGKWVLVFQQFPYVHEGDTLISPSINGQDRYDTIIQQRGAAGILILAPITQAEFNATAEKVQIAYSEPNHFGLEYLDNSSDGPSRGYNMIAPTLAARILGIKPTLESVQAYRESLIENITEFSPTTTGYSLSHTPHTSRSTLPTENVLALHKGSDPELRNEVVVLTSHYDHIGVGYPDSTGDAIYNGADDDGSGTVALLNIAKALSEAKAEGYAPRRSVLFLHVTAEELGLLGSRYYSDHPAIPMHQTVANINIDMIGRIDPTHEEEEVENYSYIIGSEIISSELDSLLKVANAHSGNIELDKSYNDLLDPNQFYRRSDHWNFGRHRVPFIFFFSGVHEDYHRPSDELHKIRFEKMARIIKTIYATTIVVANEETPPQVDNEAFIDITKPGPR